MIWIRPPATALAELIREEKEKGKSVVWASREFEEMERCCDRIGIPAKRQSGKH